MDIIKIVQEKMSQNTYLIVKDDKDAVLIDAGVYVGQIEEHLKMYAHKPKIHAVLLTHSHFDHIEELDNIVNKYGCEVYIHETGKKHLSDPNKNLSCLDVPFKIKTKGIKTFVDGEELNFNNINVICYNTPGHSVDSSCFVIGDNMFTGDTVFKVEVGRTDLFSGSSNVQRITLERIRDELSESIKMFYPGHGPNYDRDDLEYNLQRTLGE